MASTPETSAAERAVVELRRCVAALRDRYGDVRAVQRLTDDVERIGLDLADVVELAPRTDEGPAARQDIVEVPSAAYDERMWRGGDDEGVGGPHG
ncbi:hypothetical protein [Streptomyces sp. TR06-5]|uniref:hypothetical protein n=1 Tax=unclassified Streptomyces TaxID=2593676 RepID=UPI0039A10332